MTARVLLTANQLGHVIRIYSRLHIPFDRQKGVRVSGMSEKAYVRSLTAMQNALGLRWAMHLYECHK